MGLYNFQERFVAAILAGEKRHTIRGLRAHPDEPGDTMHLYTGLRTKKSRLLGRAMCAQRQDIVIVPESAAYDRFAVQWPFSAPCPLCGDQTTPNKMHECSRATLRVEIDGERLSSDEVEALFFRDGFPGGSKEAAQFWRGRLPFFGHIYHWGELKRA